MILPDSRLSQLSSIAVLTPPLALRPSFGTKGVGAATPLPTELVRYIFEFAASDGSQKPNLPAEPSLYTLQLVSRSVRKWIHPLLYAQLRILTISRLKDFVQTFDTSKAGCVDLLGQSVYDLSLLDDTRGCAPFLLCSAAGRFCGPTTRNAFLARILEMCKSVKRLSINYITEGSGMSMNMSEPGARPQELSVQRGIKGIDLTCAPFENITKLHFRCEQLVLYVLERLPLDQLTHVCFRHHFRIFPDLMCVGLVSKLLKQKNIERVIVEVAYEQPTEQGDPSVRNVLAVKWPQEPRLVVRLSPYELGLYEEKVFQERKDVWDVSRDLQWRENAWNLA